MLITRLRAQVVLSVVVASKFFDDVFQHNILKAQFPEYHFELGFRCLKFLHPLDIRSLASAILGLSLIVSGNAHTLCLRQMSATALIPLTGFCLLSIWNPVNLILRIRHSCSL